VRDVRDYRIYSSEGREMITGGSAFNIKAESLRMGDFTQPEVETLVYQQHTTATGQIFTPEALALAWELTQGQPWLVNALAYEVTSKLCRDRGVAITAVDILTAKENLIQRRETHLDQLIDKLQEERVRRVISPMLEGETSPKNHPHR
jgi:ABC-type ATPase with predicted acetyltransferase domain